MRHEHGQGYKMQAGKRLRQLLVVAHQAAEARHPRKRTFDDLAPRRGSSPKPGFAVGSRVKSKARAEHRFAEEE